jgi:hypothetical protein
MLCYKMMLYNIMLCYKMMLCKIMLCYKMMLYKIMLCYNMMLYKIMFKGVFTLGVKESSIMSLHTKLVISNLNLFTSKILC